MSEEKESNRARFIRVAGPRIEAALHRLELLKPLANKKQYEYTDAEVAAIMAELDKTVASVKAAFSPEPKEKPKRFDLATIAQNQDAAKSEIETVGKPVQPAEPVTTQAA